MNGLKRGSAAIVGVAESDLGQVAEGMSVIDLMAQGIHRALADCGLGLKDVDGVFSATTQARTSALALCEYLKLDPAFVGSTIVGGSSFEIHVAHAMAAINAVGLLRVSKEGEMHGLDLHEHGISAYPEYVITSAGRPAGQPLS